MEMTIGKADEPQNALPEDLEPLEKVEPDPNMLDRSKPFAEVCGTDPRVKYRYEQGGKFYNADGQLTESQQRGKEIFERSVDNLGEVIIESNRCVTCHPAPYFTNKLMADVSTLAETDDPMLFDTPHLTNVFASAPYLHDGRAMTLEEIWTVYGEDDKHGRVNDLTKTQLNDLVNYLKALRSPKYETEEVEVQYGAVFHQD